MNAITIWLGIPLFIALVAFFLRRFPDLAYPLVILTCLLMIGFSLFVKVGEPFALGESTVVISPSMVIGGRLITINAESMRVVNFIYFITMLWMIAGWRMRPNRFFPGFGLFIIVFLIAGLYVEPAFYAGFLFLIVAFLFVPLWVKAGSIPRRSAYRFLVMMFFGLPFFFLAGWQFSSIQIGLDNQQNLIQGGILISLGVVAFLSAFPMHSWIPMISVDSDPLILGFFMTTFPFIVIRYFLNQVVSYDLVGALGRQFQIVWLIVALITLLLGAYGMAISRKLTRFLAYYLIFGVGIALVAMSLFDLEGWKQIEIWWFGMVVNVIVFLFAIKPFQRFDFDLDKMAYSESDAREYGVSFLGMLPMLVLPFTIGFVGFIGIYEKLSVFATWAVVLMLISLMGIYVFVGRYFYKFVQFVDWKNFKLTYREEEVENSEIILQNRWLLFNWSIYFLFQAVLGLFPMLLESIGIG